MSASHQSSCRQISSCTHVACCPPSRALLAAKEVWEGVANRYWHLPVYFVPTCIMEDVEVGEEQASESRQQEQQQADQQQAEEQQPLGDP